MSARGCSCAVPHLTALLHYDIWKLSQNTSKACAKVLQNIILVSCAAGRGRCRRIWKTQWQLHSRPKVRLADPPDGLLVASHGPANFYSKVNIKRRHGSCIVSLTRAPVSCTSQAEQVGSCDLMVSPSHHQGQDQRTPHATLCLRNQPAVLDHSISKSFLSCCQAWVSLHFAMPLAT